jgi:hypothetical protein
MTETYAESAMKSLLYLNRKDKVFTVPEGGQDEGIAEPELQAYADEPHRLG